MRKLLAICFAMMIICTFAACGDRPATDTGTTANTESSITGTEETAESSAEDDATASTVGSTTESTSVTEEAHRTVEILRSDLPVYGEPSHDYFPTGTIGYAGTYTIVEEVLDAEGDLWGRLASGAGWVDLSLIEEEANDMPPVTVARASDTILSSGDHHYCQADTSSYAYDISISAHEPLFDVSFFPICIADDLMRGPDLFRISQMDPSKPLVASVYFPGSASTYGLEFTDQNGVSHIYTIFESGRNGYVYMAPFHGTLTPAGPDTAS